MKQIKIAVTGGAGSGKSTIISKFIEVYPSIYFVSFDKVVEDLYEKDDKWKSYLNEKFGTSVKSEVSKIAFENPALRSELMAKSAMKLGFMLGRRMLSCDQLIEFPLLFEAGMDNMFDKIILITANDDVRCNRIVQRSNNSINEQQAQILISTQMPELEKQKLADYSIDTSYRSIDSLVHEFAGIYFELTK